MKETLKIGEVARRAGVTTKTIRFYEAARVLPPPSRGANGYRLYTGAAVETFQFIKQATGLGLTLAEIRDVLAIRQRGQLPYVHVRALLHAKARELDQKLADVLELRRRIRQSLRAWRRRGRVNAVVCPHIETRANRPSARARR